MSDIREVYTVWERVKLTVSRAQYAATGTAIGAAAGGLISRNAASTGAALGALAGATFGEKRVSVGSFVDHLREEMDARAVLSEKE